MKKKIDATTYFITCLGALLVLVLVDEAPGWLEGLVQGIVLFAVYTSGMNQDEKK